MRQIGTVPDETTARRFVSYLATQGIDALAEEDSDKWAIWVRDEDHRQRAAEEFQAFLDQPDHPRYLEAERKEADQRHRERGAVRPTLPLPVRLRPPRVRRPREPVPVTMFLIALSVAVTLLGWFGRLPTDSLGGAVYRELRFAGPTVKREATGTDALASIRQGELWRLFTPIFLHFDYAHIIFNMLMFYHLAAQIERRRGPLRLTALVLLTALVGNLTQAYFKGPEFGGMSGVVYGLLGYLWMKSVNEPDSGFHLDGLTIAVAVAWFFLCVFEVIPNVANHAHAGGLGTGILVGLFPTGRRRNE